MTPHTYRLLEALVHDLQARADDRRRLAQDCARLGLETVDHDIVATELEEITDELAASIDLGARDSARPLGERVALVADLATLRLCCMCPGATAQLVDGLYECVECGRIAVASSMGHLVTSRDPAGVA